MDGTKSHFLVLGSEKIGWKPEIRWQSLLWESSGYFDNLASDHKELWPWKDLQHAFYDVENCINTCSR